VFSDFDGIDENTRRRLDNIAAHNDLLLFLVFDPAAEHIEPGPRDVIGDGRLQAAVDLSSEATREAMSGFSRDRLERIRAWQPEINLSVLPLSAGRETLPQIRELLGRAAGGGRIR